MLDDLPGVIEKLQNTIKNRQDYLSQREMRTRAVLIDPLLRKLGWDVSEPDMVQIEYEIEKKRADYAVMSGGKAVTVIEAKALGKPLEDDATDQVLNYANKAGIPYMAVTDGDKRVMYDVFKKGALDERQLMKFELSKQPAREAARQALKLKKVIEDELYLEYWTELKNNLELHKSCFKIKTPLPQPFMYFGVGVAGFRLGCVYIV